MAFPLFSAKEKAWPAIGLLLLCLAAAWLWLDGYEKIPSLPSVRERKYPASGRNRNEASETPAPLSDKGGLAAKASPADIRDWENLIRRALDSGDSSAIRKTLEEVLPRWVAADPAGAADFAKGLKPGSVRELVLTATVSLWAGTDGTSAMTWIEKIEEVPEQELLLGTALMRMAENDPKRAFDEAEARRFNDRNPESQMVLANLLRLWAGRDAGSAQQWALALEAGEARDRYVQSLVLVQAKSDSAAAMNLALDEIRDGPAQDEAVMSVLHQWAQRDPSGANAWVTQLDPQDPLRSRARTELDNLVRYR